jgi:hypothetical protein
LRKGVVVVKGVVMMVLVVVLVLVVAAPFWSHWLPSLWWIGGSR